MIEPKFILSANFLGSSATSYKSSALTTEALVKNFPDLLLLNLGSYNAIVSRALFIVGSDGPL